MCTGRVDMTFLLRAFQKGADGVMVGGCWLGECNYVTEGNYDALNLVHLCKKVLEHKGVNPDRLRIEWFSASEGIRFAEAMTEFTEQLKALGPLGSGEENGNGKLASELEEVAKLVPYMKLVKQEKLAQRFERQEDYEALYTLDEVKELLRGVISYYIDPEKCQACMICGRHCPVDGIAGRKSQLHVINQELCIHCGTCAAVCPQRFDAVREIVGEPVPDPVPEDQREIVREGK